MQELKLKRQSTAARELGVHRATVSAWAAIGRLTGVTIDGTLHIVVDEKYQTEMEKKNER
jgi:predicted site-specific integrase-resolvase